MAPAPEPSPAQPIAPQPEPAPKPLVLPPVTSDPEDWRVEVQELEASLQAVAAAVGDERDFEALFELASFFAAQAPTPDDCSGLAQLELGENALLRGVCDLDYPWIKLSSPGWRPAAARTRSTLDDAFVTLWETADYDPLADADGTLGFSVECVPLGEGRFAATYEATLPFVQAAAPAAYTAAAELIRERLTGDLAFGPDAWCEGSDQARESELLRILKMPLSEQERASLEEAFRASWPNRSPPSGPRLVRPAPAEDPQPMAAVLQQFLQDHGRVECVILEEEFSQSCVIIRSDCPVDVMGCQGDCDSSCVSCQDDCASLCLEQCVGAEDELGCQVACAHDLPDCRESCRADYPDCFYACEDVPSDCYGSLDGE